MRMLSPVCFDTALRLSVTYLGSLSRLAVLLTIVCGAFRLKQHGIQLWFPDQFAVGNDGCDAIRIADVQQRISIQENEFSKFAWPHASHGLLKPEVLHRVGDRGLQGL